MERGGQPGNTNATKNRPITDLIRKALLEDNARRARMLADKLCEMAANGELGAIKEVLDRTEGKVPQAMEHSGPDGSAIMISVASEDTEA